MTKLTGSAIIKLFGQNLRRIRRRKNISQLALASKTDLTHNFINEIENGRKWVSSDTIARLATILETDPLYFFISQPPEAVDTGVLDEYLEDVSDSFTQMVRDFRASYLHQPDEDDKKS
jgi:transcriptional regulator with XRE-family HTH domain